MNNGKSSSGCLIFILLVVLAGYITYNEIRMRQMNANLSAAAAKSEGSGKVRPDDLVNPLVSGRRHALRAQRFLRDKEYDKAEDELSKAVSNLKEAQDSAEKMYGHAKGFLESARDAASSAVQRTREGVGNLRNRGSKSQEKGKE